MFYLYLKKSGRLKKLDSKHREGIRIYTGAFRTLPDETLHAEAYDQLLELRRNQLKIKNSLSCIN